MQMPCSCEHGDEYYMPANNQFIIEDIEPVGCDAYLINAQSYILEEDAEIFEKALESGSDCLITGKACSEGGNSTVWLFIAIGIAFLVTMPVSAFFASDLVQEMSNNSGFTPMPTYNKTLSAFDVRMQKTLVVDDFLQQSEGVLNDRMKVLIKE